MKRTNRNKIVISSLLATVLIGAGAIKVSNDSMELATYNLGGTKAANVMYDDQWYGQRASVNPEQLDQKIVEQKAASSEWVEYKSAGVTYEQGNDSSDADSGYKPLANNAYVALNYSLVNSPELVSFGDVVTNQYYEVGVVFRYQNHEASDNFKTLVNNVASNGLLNDNDEEWAEDNSIGFMHKYWGVEDYDEFDVVDNGFTDFYTTDTSMATQDLEHRAVYGHIQDFQSNVSYEDWHKSFDNDETTLFGATSYSPRSHLILRFPIADNPGDNDYSDSFGVTPSAYQHPSNHYGIYGDAVSNKDILAISQLELSTRTGSSDKNDSYAMTFGQASSQFDIKHPEAAKDWDTKMDHAMELSFPEPEFTITPLGYNDRNQFEVDVIYDHKAIPTNYDMVSEITYTMMGPEYKYSTEEDPKVLWDEITITDQKVTREHRKAIDDPETVVDTIWTYGQPIPEELEQWIDNDKDNGGNVDIDGNSISGAEDMFPDGYDGDMEIGAEDSAHSVIKYDGLFYGDNKDDLKKQYSFTNTITLAPTDLGRDNAYLLAVPEGKSVTKEFGPWVYTIEPGSAAPIVEHFEVIKPESTDNVDPFGTMELEYSGDTKSVPEDLGVGLKPSYLDWLQVIAVETDEFGNVIDEDNELALTELFKPTNLDSETGAFSGKITTKEGIVLNAKSNYRISLRAYYGNETLPEDPTGGVTLVTDYTKPGEFITISTDDLGDLNVNVTNNVVTYDVDKPELGATLTFDYNQSIPDGYVGDTSGFTNPEIAKVEIVNYLGEENEEVIEEVDASGITLTDTAQTATVNVSSDKLLPNKTYDLSVRVTTVEGRTSTSKDVNEGIDFTTPATGPFAPVVGILAPINTVDVTGGVTTDFEFKLDQQLGDGIDEVETSASNITNIALTIKDGADDSIVFEQPSIDIPTEDSSTIIVSDSTTTFNTVSEYDYAITVTYAGDEPVVKEGKLSFELNGFSELEAQDVVMTDISSTMTSLYFETEIKDVEIAPGYDSFFVNKVEVVDAENKPVDATITWYNEEGTIIDAPVDTEEGVEFSGKFSAQLINIAAGTDLSTYQIHINTNSINESEDDTTPFETDYYFNIFELAALGGLTDDTGNFLNSPDLSKEFMDIEPIEVSDFVLNEELLTVDSATFQLTFNDKLDVITKENLVLKDNNGTEYSLAAGNMTVEHLNSRAAGMKTYEFTLTGLKDNTEYTGFTVSYEISENLGTEEAPIVSSTSYTVETDATFTTLEAPKPESKFPWWIIILLLILTIVGILLLLAFLFLRKVRVVSTSETTKGSATFVVNRDKQSGFLDTINGAKLEATQNGNKSNVEFKASVNADNKVAITLTGITNDAPIKGLKFIVDNSTVEASNAKVEAANKSLEGKFAKETEAYQAAVKTWEENKAKATEAGKEFTEAKPAAPAKPTLEKLAKPNKDVTVIGSVKTALEDSSNKEEPKKPATEEKPAAKKTTTATTAAKKPAVKKPTGSKTEEENKSAKGSAEVIY